MDFSYLQPTPQLHLWCVGFVVHLDWKALLPWRPPEARLTLAVEELRAAVAEFFKTLLAEMGERVACIVREGWRGKPCDIDAPALAREQIKREQAAAAALVASRPTDWDQVRGWLLELDGLVQKS